MPDFVSVLDIGASEIRALAAGLNDRNGFEVLGFATAKSTGVKKGIVTDLVEASSGVSEAVNELSRQIDREIKTLVVAVNGAHLEGANTQGLTPIVPKGRHITHQDVLEVVKHSRSVALPPDRVEIQALRGSSA